MASLKANKDSYWGPLLMLYCFNYFTEDPAQIELYNSFPEEIQNGYYGQLLKKELIPENLIGKRLPAFSAPDRNGNIHSDSDLRKNKKCVLIDFWASWCPPCRRDMPNLVAAYKKYKNKGFEIVGISLDSKADAWAKGVKDLNITWTQLSDLQGWKNSGAQLYGVNSIPHTVLVDKDGTIIAKNLHGEEIDAKLQEILK